ncbi:MAG: hypothetical protein O4861_14395 [Trichodesmium sp. St16_bin4-tuft]|uniref:Uncharacterized protein n=1 Tax=Trichodesmium erythraeum (strain IMS101) TaxID=203124 RepID=Q115N7_TRIEI|nr:hypothetical protein [Trichodesmium sp. ALOHA_ZT_67]MDE5068119.1 hypothetical protein [Trichodesmium sp. St4_bin8_1]MDE5070519.1 hypothetical protein [Trichodesmium sp. St5_bin8]MDE5078715.1 hypothetical protein [Trichodesmium sp. St2_bin6]MDE5099452.1 hypothetical protein [Trichodesmium sp. St16_bin4-tuft]MDE5102426.1 hypothetical protein [Trichodesmium sp. St19_bin2]MDT9341048.1 hypothetical protein [Trichodesmium erythraeum 21-75]
MTSNRYFQQLNPQSSFFNTDSSVTIAWLDLIASTVDNFDGDDWLALCGDIDEGEIYRDWFIWQDIDFPQEWEAYDLVTKKTFVTTDLSLLKAKINAIEDARSKTFIRN